MGWEEDGRRKQGRRLKKEMVDVTICVQLMFYFVNTCP